MANNNETTTKFKVDISELKSAMQDAKRQIALANSEFKAGTSLMDDWGKSSDGIKAKLKQLNSTLDAQLSVQVGYEATLEKIVEQYGENSKEAQEYQIKLNNQTAVVNKTIKELAKYELQLEDIEQAEKIASKTGKDVSEVLDEVKDSAKNAGDGFTTLKGAIATFAGNALTGLANGIKDLAGNLIGLAESTREYREDIGKLETAFANSKVSVDDAKETYKDFYSVLGEEDRSVEAVNHLAKFVDSQKDLAKWTDICTGVWGTFGDSLPIEGLTEASNETMKTGKLTGVLADALNWAGVNEDDFQAKLDKCTNEQERQALITDTLNGLYSESAEAYRKNNKSVIEANKANSNYTDALAKMGETIEPVMTTVKQGFADLLTEALKLVNDVDFEAFKGKVESAFTVLKDNVLPAVKDGLGWIIDHKDELIAGIAGIASALVTLNVANMVMGLVKAFQAFKVAQEGATIAQQLLNIVMSANPIGIVIALIAGLVTAFVVLWNKSDAFREFWINLWETVKSACVTAWEAITSFFTETIPALITSIGEWFSQLPTVIGTWLSSVITKVATWASELAQKGAEGATNFVNKIVEWFRQLPEKIWTWLTNVITKVSTWATNLAQKGKEAGQKLMDSIINKVKEIPDKIKTIGSDIVKGLWNGINDMASWIKEKIQGFGDNVLGALKDFFGIHSPSKLMEEEIGKFLPMGIAVGIDKNAKSVMNAMKDLTMNTVGATRDGLNTAFADGGITGGVVNNFTQVINSPKQLSRLDIYRQSKNLLGYAGGGY